MAGQNDITQRGKQGMAKRGKIAKRKTSPKKNKSKKEGPSKRRASVARNRKSDFMPGKARVETKLVGTNKQFRFTSNRYRTNISRAKFGSEKFQKELLDKTKKFRKKYNTTKTRVIAEIRIRRAGKTKSQFISIGRAEFGDVNQRVKDTITRLQKLMSGYARQGFRITRISGIQLQRVTRAKKKAKKRK